MLSKITIFISLLSIYHTHCALLLWSKRKVELSPLKKFTNDDLQKLIEEQGHPELAIYKTSSTLPAGFKELLDGYYTAYTPNDYLNTENATELSSQEDLELLKIKQQFQSSQDNVLSLISINNDLTRNKREVSSTTVSSSEDPEETTSSPPQGPVLYRGKSKKDDTYGLLYSSKPLMLKSPNSSVLYLGSTSDDLITVDTQARDSYTRLNINIPVEEGNKVTLRFIFTWSIGYWSLTSVKISDTNNRYNFNLSTEEKVTAPAHFSFHCTGKTLFSDSSAELHITNLQVQIDSPNGIFQDAYDCVNFTTAPIWAGIFVTALLGIGLIIALTAIGEIKTMDKFDNQKTKQLAITVVD